MHKEIEKCMQSGKFGGIWEPTIENSYVDQRSASFPFPDRQPNGRSVYFSILHTTILDNAPRNAEIVFVLCGCEALMVKTDHWARVWEKYEQEKGVKFFIMIGETAEFWKSTATRWDAEAWTPLIAERHWAMFRLKEIVGQPPLNKQVQGLQRTWDLAAQQRRLVKKTGEKV